MQVSEVTNSKVRVCSSDATLEDIIQLMWDNEADCLFVMDGSRPLGFISEESIIAGIIGRNRHLDQMQAREFVTQKLPCPAGSRTRDLGNTAGRCTEGLATRPGRNLSPEIQESPSAPGREPGLSWTLLYSIGGKQV